MVSAIVWLSKAKEMRDDEQDRCFSGKPTKNRNTDRLTASFVIGAEERNEVEVIPVHSYDINPCIGCNTCFTSPGNECVQEDDMPLIYRKLKETDMIVIASPVYFYGLSSQLKAVIDRLHTPMRNRFPVRKLGLILVGAAELPELFDAIITQYRLVLNFFHLEDMGMVLVRGVREKGDLREEDLKNAYSFGRSLK